jgi:DNA-directed RNA polymerase sigma subunit (sigma70/sigma32)
MYTVLGFEDYRDKENLIKKFETAYGNEQFFEIVMKQLADYHERASLEFSMYFGYKQPPMTLKDIGKKMNCSRTRAGVLSNKAFRFLIHPIHRKEIWANYGYEPNEKPE